MIRAGSSPALGIHFASRFFWANDLRLMGKFRPEQPQADEFSLFGHVIVPETSLEASIRGEIRDYYG
jgi:hypothetical protein